MTEPHHRGTVLVAEDDRNTATILRFGLERAGYHVVLVNDGHSAMAASDEGTFDCALVDHVMPRANGTEVCRHIRANPRHGSMPIVFCTAKALELDAAVLKSELGVREVFYKPFSMVDVIACIDEAIAERGEDTDSARRSYCNA